MQINLVNTPLKTDAIIVLANKKTDWKKLRFGKTDTELIQLHLKKDIKEITFHGRGNVFISILEVKKDAIKTAEDIRRQWQSSLAGMRSRFRFAKSRDKESAG